ncbi:MAG: hypothetical protein J0L93_01495 [Deltaproteobacteria bacterium]|nr:hypothetical protein [Deltaproteobacteria bacterium]
MKFFISAAILLGLASIIGCKQDLPKPADIKKQLESSVCTTEVKECNDGSWVSRDPDHSCSFKNCPEATTSTPLKKE